MKKRRNYVLPDPFFTQVGMLPAPVSGAIKDSKMINFIVRIGKVTQGVKRKKKIIKQP